MKEKKEKSVWGWIFEFASIHKNLYVISVIVAAMGVVCNTIPYFIVADVIQKLLEGNRNLGMYVQKCLMMGLFLIGGVVCHSISTGCSHKATFHVLGNIRKGACDKLTRLPLGTVLSQSSGSLKNIIMERIDSIEVTLAHVMPEFTANILAPVCIFIYLLAIDWRMALVSLITLPLGFICFMGMMIGYDKNFKDTVDKTKRLNDTAVEYINGIEVIKVFGKTDSSYAKFTTVAKEAARSYVDWMNKTNFFFTFSMIIMPATMVTVLPIGGIFFWNGTLSAADFILVIILSLGLIPPILTCMSYTDALAKLNTVIGEVTGILESEELERPKQSRQLPADSSIKLEQVRFGYNEKEVLHGINMEIKEGTVNALVGASGSGKSTIAKLIASLWDVSEGSICIGGVNIKDLSLEDYNNHVAYVSQESFLFDGTIRENIAIGKKGATDREVEEAARQSGCHDFIMGLEKGYDTVVGASGGHLSGGERQRISIARAMLKDAPIVILDEATAYTDPENEAIIQSSVARLVKGKTLLVIAHRLSTISDANRIFVIQNGTVAEEGTHEELLEKNGLYKDMWEAHISVKDTVEEGTLNV